MSQAHTTKYTDWMRTFVQRHNGFVRGKCEAGAKAMAKAFPELTVVAGFAHWVAPHGRSIRDQHWWCEAKDGSIVDPTAAQFGSSSVRYQKLDLTDPCCKKLVPTGRCMNCCNDVYEHDTFCSDKCAQETIDYMEKAGI